MTTHDSLAAARDKVSETAHVAIETAGEKLAVAKDVAGDALHAAHETAVTAYAVARDKTGTATRVAADGIEANPIVALIGGIALGAIAGALIPRSQKEAELLGPLGARLGDAAREALGAAKQAGLASFDDAGFNRDAIRAQVDKLLDGASQAASAATGAATAAVKKPA